MPTEDREGAWRTKAIIALIIAAVGLFLAPFIRSCLIDRCLSEKDGDPFNDFLSGKKTHKKSKQDGTEDEQKGDTPDESNYNASNISLVSDDKHTDTQQHEAGIELQVSGSGSRKKNSKTLSWRGWHNFKQHQSKRQAPKKSVRGFQHDFEAANSVEFYLDCVGQKVKRYRDDDEKKHEDGCCGGFCGRVCPSCNCCSDRFRFSVAFRSISHAVFFGFLSIFVSWVGYECGESTWSCAEVFSQQMAAIYGIYKIIAPLLIFILAIYVNNRLSWWFTLKTKCWKVQGGLHEFALLIGSAMPGRSHDDDPRQYINAKLMDLKGGTIPEPITDTERFGEERLKIKYRVYRYINLIHYFMYYSAHKGRGDLDDTLDKLVNEGLLTANEKLLYLAYQENVPIDDNPPSKDRCRNCFKNTCDNPFWCCMPKTDSGGGGPKQRPRANGNHRLPLLWLGQLLGHLAKTTDRLTHNEAFHLWYSLRRIRGDIVSLLDTNTNKPPYSWMQLLQIYVDVVLLITPFALYAVAADAGDGDVRYHMQAWNCIGTVASAVIFQGMLEMVHVMDDSWGTDLDDLNANSTLLSTERSTFFYLSEDTHKEKHPLSDDLPPEFKPTVHRNDKVPQPKATQEAIEESNEEDSGLGDLVDEVIKEDNIDDPIQDELASHMTK